MLTISHGFTAEKLVVDAFNSGVKVASRTTKHAQPLKKLTTKQKAVNRSLYTPSGVSNRVVFSTSYTRPSTQKRFYTTYTEDAEQTEDHSQFHAIPLINANSVEFSNAPLTKIEQEELQGRLKSIDAGGDFAIPTTDSGFKHLLALEPDNEPTIISFLNTFVPAFYNDRVKTVTPAPISIPILPRTGFKQTFMDAHVVSEKGIHYIIEMQAKRHIYFDERALFYACSTYASQIGEENFKDKLWYLKLKPVIALQVLDYDTNRVTGLKEESGVIDTLLQRVRTNPLPEKDFVKHFLMTCQKSAQKLDHLQIVQVELGRVKEKLYPPHKEFTELDWWLSTFKFAGKYTQNYIMELEEQGIIMPKVIKAAFERLRYSKWNPKEIREYKSDVTDRENDALMLEVERAEGRAEGEAKGRAEGRAEGEAERNIEITRKMAGKGMDRELIFELTGLYPEELGKPQNTSE